MHNYPILAVAAEAKGDRGKSRFGGSVVADKKAEIARETVAGSEAVTPEARVISVMTAFGWLPRGSEVPVLIIGGVLFLIMGFGMALER